MRRKYKIPKMANKVNLVQKDVLIVTTEKGVFKWLHPKNSVYFRVIGTPKNSLPRLRESKILAFKID